MRVTCHGNTHPLVTRTRDNKVRILTCLSHPCGQFKISFVTWIAGIEMLHPYLSVHSGDGFGVYVIAGNLDSETVHVHAFT